MEKIIYWQPKEIYSRIDELCNARGWSLHNLCIEANLTSSTIYSNRARLSYPSFETLNAICKALGISLSEFFVTTGQENDLLIMFSKLDVDCQFLIKEIMKRLYK